MTAGFESPPDEVLEGEWIDFIAELPVDGDTLRHHIRAALARGLEEVRMGALAGRSARIVANGPSARQAPLSAMDGRLSVALNGALALFRARGQAPDYFVACDPQALVAEFLADAPPATTYLIASRCHPRVFQALAGRRVLIWHLDEADAEAEIPTAERIGAGLSVTNAALMLLHHMGVRSMDIWGLDCSLAEDGAHHAGQGAVSGPYQPIRVGDRLFQSKPAWAAEAQQFLLHLHAIDAEVTVNGEGMLAAILAEFGRRQAPGA
ncbi:6-hydroxymethylpterin diphosphokinase MptE-like protein [Azospirillum sp. B4]|uniref:6-hydroxymethylpterin diphosphokinase MptE-like protein n=1 Tax=Azospirillum sp. B4 TaxID=95605 RepID=UPI000349F715|nr:6-hydroxymethylpterin diphosphokinase MptE-like protein [Azospirillum sp. B4]